MPMITRGLTVVLLALALLGQTAHATTKENVERLKQHFATLGEVRYQVFAPLGQDGLKRPYPELGAAEIETGGTSKLVVVQVGSGKGGLTTLISEPFESTGAGADFDLLGIGNHLITYASEPWTDGSGIDHTRGDLLVRDLTAPGVPTLFELRDAVDLGFTIGSRKFQDNLVMQPALHFLNSGERLPRRFAYSRLAFDEVSGQYKLVHHLTPLPEAHKVVAANLNNKGILYYRAGHLRMAEEWFSRATTQAAADQGLIAHNTELVGVEIESLAGQGGKRPEQPFDEALMAYWQGDFAAALTQLSARSNLGEFDYALLGLALAQERRWPEVDNVTRRLHDKSLSASGRGKQFYADYLGEVIRIAFLQGPHLTQVAARYLKALEALDRGHPVYIEGLAELLLRGGNTDRAAALLERGIEHAAADANLTLAFNRLYELYTSRGKSTTALLADASRGPLHNVGAYVDLVDYYDLRPALAELEYEGEETFTVKGQLNFFGVDERAVDPNAPPAPDFAEPVFEGGVIKGTQSDLQ
jgi:hypothetical protein